MGDPPSLDAELGQLLDGALGVHDDPAEPAEQPRPDGAGAGAPRDDVVRGQDRGSAEPAHPAPVELRPGQPLDVHEVGSERLEPAQQAPRARQVFDALEQ